jgi:hypothetical protein
MLMLDDMCYVHRPIIYYNHLAFLSPFFFPMVPSRMSVPVMQNQHGCHVFWRMINVIYIIMSYLRLHNTIFVTLVMRTIPLKLSSCEFTDAVI